MKVISILILFIGFVGSFTGCSDNASYTINSYSINASESRDVPASATIVAKSEGTKIKITRDIESDSKNIYVISGSIEVTETGDSI